MNLPLPSRLVCPHVAQAVEVLHMADDALGELYDAMAEIPIEEQRPINCFDVDGFRATCTLFASILAVGEGFISPFARLIRNTVRDCDASEGNAPGLERAELALDFAIAEIEEALDALDKMPGGDEWHGPLTAAASVLCHLHTTLAGSIVRHGAGPDRTFSDN